MAEHTASFLLILFDFWVKNYYRFCIFVANVLNRLFNLLWLLWGIGLCINLLNGNTFDHAFIVKGGADFQFEKSSTTAFYMNNDVSENNRSIVPRSAVGAQIPTSGRGFHLRVLEEAGQLTSGTVGSQGHSFTVNPTSVLYPTGLPIALPNGSVIPEHLESQLFRDDQGFEFLVCYEPNDVSRGGPIVYKQNILLTKSPLVTFKLLDRHFLLGGRGPIPYITGQMPFPPLLSGAPVPQDAVITQTIELYPGRNAHYRILNQTVQWGSFQ